MEIAQLRAAGVEVVPFLRSSDEIGTLPLTQRALLPVSPLYSGPTQRALADILRTERPDVLHLHNPYPLLSPWVVRTAHANGVPVVHTVHNYRQVCVNGVFFRDGAHLHGLRRPALSRCRPFCTRATANPGRRALVMATTLAAHRSTWHSVDRFIALTDAMAEHLTRYGIAADRIVVKPNSVPDPGEPAPLGDGFLLLGRLVEDKGIGLLLDAWSRHEVGALGVLRIGGDGPLRARWRPPTAPTSSTSVRWTGPRYGRRWTARPSC